MNAQSVSPYGARRGWRPALLTLGLALMSAAGPTRVAAQSGASPASDSLRIWRASQRLVFSASRYAQDASEAPASVTIITADEIRQQGYRTLADILGAVRGIFTYYDREYAYATVRGMSRQSDFNTRLLLLIDGHRINDAATDASGIGTDALVDVDLIEHVEVIMGPGSALFGTNALFGVVNLVTRRGRQLPGVQGTAEAGSFGYARGALSFGTRVRGSHELLVSGSAERRGGQDLYYREFDSPQTDNGVVRGMDGEQTYRGLAKGSMGDFSALAAYSARERDVPTASYSTVFDDPRFRTHDRTATATLSYEHSFEDLSRAFVTAAFDSYRYDGQYPYSDVLFRDYNHSQAWSLQGEYLRYFGSGHKLTFGGETQWLSGGQIGGYDVDPRVTYLDLNRSRMEGAAYGQLEWRFGTHAIAYAGLRHDRYEGVGGTTNPRAALVLHPFSSTTVKALYGQAFRAPNLYELYYQDGDATQKAPKSLKPERVRTTEVTVEQAITSSLFASVSAYRIRTRDLINLETDPADSLLVFANGGRPRGRGVEFELAGHAGAVEGRISYAYQDAIDDSSTTPANSPHTIVHGGASVPLFDGRSHLALEVRHLGSRPTLGGTSDPAYTVANLTLHAAGPGPGTEVSVSVRNLFDARYADPGGEEHLQVLLPRDGRSVRVAIRHRF
jgi:outer membrane receptor protein involved in Fe transport